MVEYDVVVIGLGGAGSSAAYHLARGGSRVLGLEQFGPTHAHGSSHGRTRIYRTVYSEGPTYVPLVRRAEELWLELQASSGERVLERTGGLFIGAPESPLVAGALRSAAAHSLDHERLTAAEVGRRFPQFALRDEEVAVWDPEAGALFVENCVRCHASGAVEAGAELHYGEAVRDWAASSGSVLVRTSSGEHRARAVVVTAGPWTARLAPELKLPLEVEQQFVLWFPPTDPELVRPQRMPVFLWERAPDVHTYGLPDFGDGVKVGTWGGPLLAAPESADPRLPESRAQPVRDFVRGSLRGVAVREREAASCLYTNSPDHHFLLGRHPRHPNVVIVSACSGHGFKFTSVVGELVQQLVRGEPTRWDLSMFDPGRFAAPPASPQR